MDAFTDDAVLTISCFLSFCDLLNLGLTCQRFGARPRVDVDVDVDYEARPWSLMEEAARQRVTDATAKHEWINSDILIRRGSESWIALDHRLHRLLRMSSSSLVFHRLIGNGIAYVKNDPSHVQVHDDALSSGQYPLGSSCAICQKVMTCGKHYAQFTVTREGYIEVGIMRPIQGWDTRDLKTMHPRGSYDYTRFCRQRNDNRVFEGDVHWYLHQTSPDNYGRSNFLRNDDVVGLLLDLDQGILSAYKNGRCLGVKKDGLVGHYCWVASVTNAVYRGAVMIESAPLPEN